MDKTEQTAKAEIKSQDNKNKKLLDELSKMPPMVIATAYLHAINYTLYGEDVTVRWITATQNAKALEKAYRKGYYDALQRKAESGDLIDRDEVNELEERLCATECDCCTLDGCFYDRATTIIEADRSVEE